jgi:staphyloferrin B biosynthesis citrate synthase
VNRPWQRFNFNLRNSDAQNFATFGSSPTFAPTQQLRTKQMTNAAKPGFREFRNRLLSQDHLTGTFVKIPTTFATEVLGKIGFDFVVFDQEHAPLDAQVLDTMILAARASGIAGIVRVPNADPSSILTVLDCGATGVLVPHIDTKAKAEAIVSACRYRGGNRGFANTTRAGGYGGKTYAEHKDTQDSEVVCIAMIEDVSALEEIEDIVRVPGLDAIFIGRGDLTAALDAPTMTSEETHEIVAPIMAAAKAAGMPIIMLCPNRADAAKMAGLGASGFMVGSDHGFLASAARSALETLKPPLV